MVGKGRAKGQRSESEGLGKSPAGWSTENRSEVAEKAQEGAGTRGGRSWVQGGAWLG